MPLRRVLLRESVAALGDWSLLGLWQVHQIVTSSKARKSECRVRRDFIALIQYLSICKWE